MAPGLVSLSQRSVETLIKTQGVGDLYRLFIGAHRDGIDYNLMYMPSHFQAESKELFDPVYMSQLFGAGYQMGLSGKDWLKSPPGVAYID